MAIQKGDELKTLEEFLSGMHIPRLKTLGLDENEAYRFFVDGKRYGFLQALGSLPATQQAELAGCYIQYTRDYYRVQTRTPETSPES